MVIHTDGQGYNGAVVDCNDLGLGRSILLEFLWSLLLQATGLGEGLKWFDDPSARGDWTVTERRHRAKNFGGSGAVFGRVCLEWTDQGS
jgi:hypothetical protein